MWTIATVFLLFIISICSVIHQLTKRPAKRPAERPTKQTQDAVDRVEMLHDFIKGVDHPCKLYNKGIYIVGHLIGMTEQEKQTLVDRLANRVIIQEISEVSNFDSFVDGHKNIPILFIGSNITNTQNTQNTFINVPGICIYITEDGLNGDEHEHYGGYGYHTFDEYMSVVHTTILRFEYKIAHQNLHPTITHINGFGVHHNLIRTGLISQLKSAALKVLDLNVIAQSIDPSITSEEKQELLFSKLIGVLSMFDIFVGSEVSMFGIADFTYIIQTDTPEKVYRDLNKMYIIFICDYKRQLFEMLDNNTDDIVDVINKTHQINLNNLLCSHDAISSAVKQFNKVWKCGGYIEANMRKLVTQLSSLFI